MMIVFVQLLQQMSTAILHHFSSYGYPGKVKPNISSVGLNTTLYSSSGLSSGSGTSFSNPNINGLIACLVASLSGI